MPDENVALNKPSWQSTAYRTDGVEPAGSQFSGDGNNGVRTGIYGFHTLFETQPWWIVDLLAPHVLTEIHIYNRLQSARSLRPRVACECVGHSGQP